MDDNYDLQNKFNMHLRRNVIFTYLGIKYNAALNLTLQNLSSLKGNIDTIDDSKFFAIENYLKTEGYFDYETN
jgi:hypothetical protein